MYKKIFRRVVFGLMYRLRLHEAFLRGMKDGDILIINIHDVGLNALDEAVFEKFLEWASVRFRILTFQELVEPIELDGLPIMVLSFDDGYYSFKEHVLPLLAKFRIGANLNLIAQCVSTGSPPFTVQLDSALTALSDRDVSGLKIPRLSRYPNESRESWTRRVMNHLRFQSVAERIELLEMSSSLLRRSLVEHSSTVRMLTAEDVLSLPKNIEIGNHSFTHEAMAYQPFEFFESDYYKSQSFFQSLIVNPKIYAFPNGSFTGDQVSFLIDRGVSTILITEDRPSNIFSQVHARVHLDACCSDEARVRGSGLLSTFKSSWRHRLRII